MIPTAGFVPPPVAPLIPLAANGIVPTAGALGGIAAGAAAGAKAGALLGPKGALVGAAVGGLLVPLLFPSPLAPGTIPGDLDPGLNDPEPSPQPTTGDDVTGTPPEGDQPGTEYRYTITYTKKESEGIVAGCPPYNYQRTIPEDSRVFSQSFTAREVNLQRSTSSARNICGDKYEDFTTTVRVLQAIFTKGDGSTFTNNLVSGANGYRTTTTQYTLKPRVLSIPEMEIKRGAVSFQPSVIPAPTKPRPKPIPLEPLPDTAPFPDTDPDRPVIPDTPPAPDPLNPPTPDDPDAEPIPIPSVPPAEPQPVPTPTPGKPAPAPGPSPSPSPSIPAPIPTPLPVPGVPTIQPGDPTTEPAPAPSPSPAPEPPAPEPVPTPLPQPPTIPAPVPVPVPGTPVPVPNPLPQPTPPGPQPQPSPEPLPTPDPTPEPGPVPIPEPGPRPEPVPVPQPGDPDVDPVEPQPIPIPQPEPGPEPGPAPGPNPLPVEPTPQPVPTPIPEIPPIREPEPEPGIFPVPDPGEVPLPFPVPSPDPMPTPQPTPLPPTIQPTPNPVPDVTRPTLPDGSLAPAPTPTPTLTPPDVHYPVPGGPGVTPGGTRGQITHIAQEVGRIEQKQAVTMNRLDNVLDSLGDIADIIELISFLQELFEQPLPEKEYTLNPVCEEEAPPTVVTLPEEKAFDRLISAIDVVPELLQAHLGYKTPTCGGRSPGPELLGDWRTISFISDEVSPYGHSRLRKRFRYRSTSGLGLPGVIDHWKDFVWSAGPVCVQHADASWGTPQCWASSIDEGKRVIRHAAGEAGIDPDQDGRWVVSGSHSARVGVSGTMRVRTKGGYYWITARDGSERRPIVGTVDHHP